MTERDASDGPAGGAPPTSAHVCIPAGLRRRIESRLAETEFESVDEYATFALEAMLREIERDDRDLRDDDTATDADDSAPVDETTIRDRLESLGYL